MQLLANTTSPFVRIARIALIEKGFDIERLRGNPELALRLARAAYHTARAHTWDRLAARVVRTAETLAQSPRR